MSQPNVVPARPPMTNQEEWQYAERALAWHGWGSPIGLGLFVLAVCVGTALVRWAFGS